MRHGKGEKIKEHERNFLRTSNECEFSVSSGLKREGRMEITNSYWEMIIVKEIWLDRELH